ncbi:MAG: SCO family protein [Deltaproteobacteria bacterium]|nr:SCO family protein [Deltaproteobacteria bacterium]
MTTQTLEDRRTRPLVWVQHVLSSWRLPIFVLSLLLFLNLLLLALLLLPASGSKLGAFAEDFRIWCFGYDPLTGRHSVTQIVAVFSEPVILALIIVGVWWTPLKGLLAGPKRAALPWVGAALALAVGAAVLVTTMERTQAGGPQPFPAERLRVALHPPAFELTNHTGEKLSLAALKGKVVLITAVYATCGHTCPMILGQAKRAVAKLSAAEKRDLRVIGITLDPERDDPKAMASMAAGQEVEAPLFNLLSGESKLVNRILDELQVARKRDKKTGVIDHANVFFVLDRRGKIAYRLTLGPQQERWLGSALKVLLRES